MSAVAKLKVHVSSVEVVAPAVTIGNKENVMAGFLVCSVAAMRHVAVVQSRILLPHQGSIHAAQNTNIFCTQLLLSVLPLPCLHCTFDMESYHKAIVVTGAVLPSRLLLIFMLLCWPTVMHSIIYFCQDSQGDFPCSHTYWFHTPFPSSHTHTHTHTHIHTHKLRGSYRLVKLFSCYRSSGMPQKWRVWSNFVQQHSAWCCLNF